jgi:hypothetical protein
MDTFYVKLGTVAEIAGFILHEEPWTQAGISR